MRSIVIKVAGVMLAIVFAAYAAVWLLGERIIAKTYDIAPGGIESSADPAVIAYGSRLADITGCTGCHGASLNGKVFGDEPFIYRSVTSNLPRLAQTYDDDDLDRAIRHGVRKNRRSVNGMPSAAFYDMTDEDVAAIISFIRTQADEGARLAPSQIRILGRLELARGQFPPDASTIDHDKPRPAVDKSDPLQLGEYVARIACAECHGLDFAGHDSSEPGAPPDLSIAAAYDLEDFRVLMKTGEAVSGRDLGMMGAVARSRFVKMTDAEIDAVHQFLTARVMGGE